MWHASGQWIRTGRCIVERGGELNDTHKATENNTAEIIGEGKSMCVCVCVCLGRDKNQGTHKSISYTHSVI